jgi:hypothetical protein
MGALLCRLQSGNAFKVGSGFSDSQRKRKNAPNVGTIITFRYFEMTKGGNPRFPVFVRVREDVEVSLLEEIECSNVPFFQMWTYQLSRNANDNLIGSTHFLILHYLAFILVLCR